MADIPMKSALVPRDAAIGNALSTTPIGGVWPNLQLQEGDTVHRHFQTLERLRAWLTGVTPEMATSLIRGAQSSARNQARLFDTMCARDPIIGSAVDRRIGKVLSAEWRFQPIDTDKTQGSTKKINQPTVVTGPASKLLKALPPKGMDKAVRRLCMAPLYGYAAVEIVWNNEGGVDELVPVPMMALDAIMGQLHIYIDGHPIPISEGYSQIMSITGPPNKDVRKRLIILSADDFDPAGAALLRRCVGPWLSSMYIVRDWNKYLEHFAFPIVKGEYDPNAVPPAGTNLTPQQAMLNALEALHNDARIAVPKDTAIEFLQAMTGEAAHAFEAILDQNERRVCRAILGQDSTTMQGQHGGARASDQVRENTEASINEDDATMVVQAINDQLCRRLEEVQGITEPLIECVYDWGKTENMDKRATMISQLASAGATFNWDPVLDEFGLEPMTDEQKAAATQQTEADHQKKIELLQAQKVPTPEGQPTPPGKGQKPGPGTSTKAAPEAKATARMQPEQGELFSMAEYNPDEARDSLGRWTAGGGDLVRSEYTKQSGALTPEQHAQRMANIDAAAPHIYQAWQQLKEAKTPAEVRKVEREWTGKMDNNETAMKDGHLGTLVDQRLAEIKTERAQNAPPRSPEEGRADRILMIRDSTGRGKPRKFAKADGGEHRPKVDAPVASSAGASSERSKAKRQLLAFAKTTADVNKDAVLALAASATRQSSSVLRDLVSQLKAALPADPTKNQVQEVMQSLLTHANVGALAEVIEGHFLASMANGVGNAQAWVSRLQKSAAKREFSVAFNPNHAPAGSPHGGEFTSKDETGGMAEPFDWRSGERPREPAVRSFRTGIVYQGVPPKEQRPGREEGEVIHEDSWKQFIANAEREHLSEFELQQAQEEVAWKGAPLHLGEEGFVTNEGRFVNRWQALTRGVQTTDDLSKERSLERRRREYSGGHVSFAATPPQVLAHTPTFEPMSPAAARKILADKLLLTPDEIDELGAGAYELAWSVATVTDLSLLEDLRDSLDEIIAEGGTFSSWLDKLSDIFDKTGWSTTGAHLSTIFSTTIGHTYEAERYDFLKENEYVDYLVFSTTEDDRVCDLCEPLDLCAWKRDDFPPEYWPLLHFCCHCTVVPADAADLDALGAEVQDGDIEGVHADEGFDTAPSISGLNQTVIDDLDERLTSMGFNLPHDIRDEFAGAT